MLCYPEYPDGIKVPQSRISEGFGGYRTLLICSLSYYVGNKTLGFQAGVLYTLLWMVAYSTPSCFLSRTALVGTHADGGGSFGGFMGDTIRDSTELA